MNIFLHGILEITLITALHVPYHNDPTLLRTPTTGAVGREGEPAPSAPPLALRGFPTARYRHGTTSPLRCGLDNMRIQTDLNAATVNLKRLAAAFLALLMHFLADNCEGKLFSLLSVLLCYLHKDGQLYCSTRGCKALPRSHEISSTAHVTGLPCTSKILKSAAPGHYRGRR